MTKTFNKIFPKSLLACVFISLNLQIFFFDYVHGSNFNTLAGRLKYQVESENSEHNIYTYHILHKRDTSSKPTINEVTTQNDDNSAPTEATRLVTKSDEQVEKNATKLPVSEATHSHYSPENEDEQDLDLKGYNGTQPQFDHHKYYNSYSKTGIEKVFEYWVDLDVMPQEKVVAHDSLSSAYRRALTVSLSFDFPFYGHTLNNVTIATGGFLFTGSFLHKWLAATQYIAPLMANFDTSVSSQATVKYADNGTALTVQWEKVRLQDNFSAGPFTFQVTIHQTGHIIFAYKDIPLLISVIGDEQHPVKVGLSDAYIVEKSIFYIRKKTIYEYHKIDLKKGMQINNWTAIIFEPLKVCVALSTCDACLTIENDFECKWCQKIGQCSDGLDRNRQIWLENGCNQSSYSNLSVCDTLPPPPSSLPTSSRNEENFKASLLDANSNGSRKSMWIGLFLTFMIVAFAAGWVTYAYLHPHTTSGQILIKYRPSAWLWRRGEARYTAATMHSIHM